MIWLSPPKRERMQRCPAHGVAPRTAQGSARRITLRPAHDGDLSAAGAAGFSLVELMVALAIGVVILMGITDLLVDSKTTFVREEQFARLQENGRIAAMVVSRHLRNNRSLDCRSIGVQQLDDSLTVKSCDLLDIPAGSACNQAGWRAFDHLLSTDRALGYDGAQDLGNPDNLPDLPLAARTNLAARWLRGDVLVTWGAGAEGVWVDGALLAADGGSDHANRIKVDGSPDAFSVRTLALLSDCVASDLFEISGPTPGDDVQSGEGGDRAGSVGYLYHAEFNRKTGELVNASGGLSRAYNWRAADDDARQVPSPAFGARIFPFSYKVFYLCCVDIDAGELQTGSGVGGCVSSDSRYDPDRYRPSFCVWDAARANSQPLVSGIADMRVAFSGDADNDGAMDFFASQQKPIPSAAWVTQQKAWSGVRSASVELLIATGGGVRSSAAAPASADWPPNGGSGIDSDTLGYGLPKDRRRYQRFQVNVAMRSRTPWYIAP